MDSKNIQDPITLLGAHHDSDNINDTTGSSNPSDNHRGYVLEHILGGTKAKIFRKMESPSIALVIISIQTNGQPINWIWYVIGYSVQTNSSISDLKKFKHEENVLLNVISCRYMSMIL